MSIDATLTRKRIDELKEHECFVSPYGGGCWKCRALKRYRADREARKERSKGGGRYHKVKK